MTYSEARAQFIEKYGQPTRWNLILSTEESPLQAYTTFETKAAAKAYVDGEEVDGEIFYSVYPGMIICVENDSIDSNNGIYEVINNPEYDLNNSDSRKYLLNKYYDATTVDTLISGIQPGSGEMHFTNADMMDDSQSRGHLIYFTGVSDMDCSANTKECDSSNMLFTANIGYDTTGTLFTAAQVSASDVRLKDHIEELDVDLGKVGEIDKVKYTWKDNMNGKRHIGTTAQSLEATFPELVYTNPETGYKAVNYEGLSVIALAAIDKLYARVRDLENTVRKLTKEQQ